MTTGPSSPPDVAVATTLSDSSFEEESSASNSLGSYKINNKINEKIKNSII